MGSDSAIVVMGVSGCGKSTVGRALAGALGWEFVEGDELHPPGNVARMSAGTPLTDADRRAWLDALAARLAAAGGRRQVLACSALKRSYRDRLRAAAPALRFVHLHAAAPLLDERLRARVGHYMPASLLPSQLEALELPAGDEAAISCDAGDSVEAIVAACLLRLAAGAGGRAGGHAGGEAGGEAGTMETFTRVVLETGADGRARFREETLALDQGKPAARLSAPLPAAAMQLRRSPAGFASAFHCTEHPQWVFVLEGRMEIGLQDGQSRSFGPGEHFYSADLLPAGETFDPAHHGHRSRALDDVPLATLFVRSP